MSENRVRQLPSWVKPLLWIVLAGALVVAAVPALLYPLTRDQGAASYTADVMMHGGAPFRDAWQPKGPGIQLLYALAFTLFGRSEFAVRLFDVLWALVSAAVIYGLAWEGFRDRAIAAGSAWVYAFSYYLMVHYHAMATAEAMMMPFLVASAYGTVRAVRRRSIPALVLAGLGGSLVFWFKPTTGVVIVALLLWAAWRVWRDRWAAREKLRGLAAVALGAALGIIPVVIFLYGNGLSELLDIWRTYASDVYLEAGGLASGNGPLAKLNVIWGYLRDWQLFAWLGLAGALSAWVWRQRNRAGEGVVVFLVSAVAAALVQGKLFEYHWIPVLAPLAVLSAVTAVGLTREIQEARGKPLGSAANALAVVVILALGLWLATSHLARFRRTAAYLAGQVSYEEYYAQFNMGGDFSPIGARNAAAYLRAHTAPNETALIWGAEPLVNFLAERRAPTRFVWAFVVLGEGPRLEAWRQEFMHDLRQAPPAYLVLVENDRHPLTPEGSIILLEQFPEFKAMLESEYAFEAQVEDYRFYRRK
jgi:4-amino-4-deoxy-L-arabinose transferase-like glycosyltransferase